MYNVQTKTQSSKLRQARIGLAVLGIAAVFITCFMATQALMTAVYGYSLETSGTAFTGLGAPLPAYGDIQEDKTAQAADKAQGYMIDSYVQNIKAEICPTLNNITAEAECLDI